MITKEFWQIESNENIDILEQTDVDKINNIPTDVNASLATKLEASDITWKADKVSWTTNWNFAWLDANWNITDSWKKHWDYAQLVGGNTFSWDQEIDWSTTITNWAMVVDNTYDWAFQINENWNKRWIIWKKSDETGSDGGSDFALYAYTDLGAYLRTSLLIKRDTWNVWIGTINPTEKLDVRGNVRSDWLIKSNQYLWVNTWIAWKEVRFGGVNRHSPSIHQIHSTNHLHINSRDNTWLYLNWFSTWPVYVKGANFDVRTTTIFNSFNHKWIKDIGRYSDFTMHLPNYYNHQSTHKHFVRTSAIPWITWWDTWALVETKNMWTSWAQSHKVYQMIYTWGDIWYRTNTSPTVWGAVRKVADATWSQSLLDWKANLSGINTFNGHQIISSSSDKHFDVVRGSKISKFGADYIWEFSNNDFRIFAWWSEGMRLSANWNVGIWTTTPSEKLEVNGNLRLTNIGTWALQFFSTQEATWNNDAYCSLWKWYDSSWTALWDIWSRYKPWQLNWESLIFDLRGANKIKNFRFKKDWNGDELLTIQSNWNVWIWTTNPTEKLDVDWNIKVNWTVKSNIAHLQATLLNGWTHYWWSYWYLNYYKTPDWTVHVAWLVKNWTMWQVIFNLPLNYRPPRRLIFNALSNNWWSQSLASRLDIITNWDVILLDWWTSWCSINLSFNIYN